VPLLLSKRTEYGLRAVVQLARLWSKGYVQSRDLALQEDLPNKFLESILLALRRGGFLESKVGSGGGYRLSRPPRQINVGELIRRLEGRLALHDPQPSQEMSPGKIAVFFLNEKITASTNQVIDNLNLEDLLEQVNRGTSLQQMYYI
jgi:Rrf2 family protein